MKQRRVVIRLRKCEGSMLMRHILKALPISNFLRELLRFMLLHTCMLSELKSSYKEEWLVLVLKRKDKIIQDERIGWLEYLIELATLHFGELYLKFVELHFNYIQTQNNFLYLFLVLLLLPLLLLNS